jgi:ArsR family transcriptional regulator, cadmium/lead-responsive transcriptional repressor
MSRTTNTLGEDAPFRLSTSPADTDLVAKYFRALGDPTRLRILELLAGGERSVGQLVDELGASQPKVSNHLACLRWCGFVTTRRDSRTIYYSVSDERVSSIIELGRALLLDNEEHVAACSRIDAPC